MTPVQMQTVGVIGWQECDAVSFQAFARDHHLSHGHRKPQTALKFLESLQAAGEMHLNSTCCQDFPVQLEFSKIDKKNHLLISCFPN